MLEVNGARSVITQLFLLRFSYVDCQLSALQRCFSVHEVRQTLERNPSGIERVYTESWNRMLALDHEHFTRVKILLTWVVFAKRAMTIDELRWALATCPDSHAFRWERLTSEGALLSLCHGLVLVDEARTVRLTRE